MLKEKNGFGDSLVVFENRKVEIKFYNFLILFKYYKYIVV